MADPCAVLDSLGIARAILVGHSIAGDELTRFVARHPLRVNRLVSLDTAADHRVQISGARPPVPTPISADSASPRAMRALASRLGQPLPETDLRAAVVFGPTGRAERDVTSGSVFGEIVKGLESPPYAQLRAPALAFL